MACAGPSIFQPIPLGLNPPTLGQPIFLAINETTARGYLINSNNSVQYSDGSLLILEFANPIAPTAIYSMSLQNFSGQAVLDPAGQNLYMTNRLSSDVNDPMDQIFRVNVTEGSASFLNLTQFDADDNPFGMVSDGTYLYVVNDSSLDFYAISNPAQRTRIDFNVEPPGTSAPVNTANTREAAFSASGQFLFVTNRGGQMLIMDPAQIPIPDPSLSLTLGGSEAIDYVISNTSSTRGIASDSNYTYVVEGSPPSLKILTDRSLTSVTGQPQQILISSIAVAEIPLGPNPNEIAVDATNNRAYVVLSQNNQVAVIDTQLLIQVAVVSLPSNTNPFGVSVGHFGGVPYVYVLNQDSNTVSIINGNTLSIVGTFP